MEILLWVLLIGGVIGSFIWLGKQLSSLKHDTLDETQTAEFNQVLREAQKKKDSQKQKEPASKPKIEQDPDSEIKYD